MGRRDYSTNLPSETTINILSRLPLRSIAISKCVCKPWRDLLGSLDFAKSLFSDLETPPVLACLTPSIYYNEFGSTCCTLFELEEEVLIEDEEGEDQNQNQNQNLQEFQTEDEDEEEDEVDYRFQNPIFHELHYNRLTNFYTQLGEAGESNPYSMVGIAANGLLLVYSQLRHPNIPLFMWNPLTRQCINLFTPKQSISYKFELSYGFGVSRISGQYKVVCINRDGSAHHVYTLRTGAWRRLEAGAASGFAFNFDGCVVCNGNLHWTVYDTTRPLLICGFDVETECFSIFSRPLAAVDERLTVELSVLSDCVCVSYALENEIVIWSMKEYGVEESWTIEHRLSTNGVNFENGMESLDTMGLPGMVKEDLRMIEDVDVWNHLSYAMIFTPVILSLKSFGIENVISF
ncbi:putative F-box protein At3g10240 [Salvia splendens]|uniref:putative F-box protein At3g10240 n=1 Tax=Salvia splendens TaxID=180675 RepID=UPI001C2560E1|nr:putative F-box protein At3g10240 [Salvia splendens]